MKLLSVNNHKTVKGEALGYRTFILYLAPFNVSGNQVCASASPGCAAACLFTAGMGVYKNVRAGRIRKTREFFGNRHAFMAQLVKDIRSGLANAKRNNLTAVFRLNGTSDIRWELVPVTVDGVEYPNVMAAFPDVTFYDYTKHTNRRNIPSNYRLTLSRSETNDNACIAHLRNGGNVAAVFAGDLPATWHGFPVINGDETDLRFLDPHGVVIGLKAKGKARKDVSGFVIHA